MNKSINTAHLLKLCLIALIFTLSQSYLQFKLYRIPSQSSSKKLKQQPYQCPQSLKSLAEADYKQVCYDKDISYSFELFTNNDKYFISADLTTPISWIKGADCKMQKPNMIKQKQQSSEQQTSKNTKISKNKNKQNYQKCSLIQGQTLNVKKIINEVENDIQHTVKKAFRQKKKVRHEDDQQDSGNEKQSHQQQQQSQEKQDSLIQGSSNIIRGHLQCPSHLAFQTIDSNRLTRLVDILLLGYYILGEKDALELESTSFINASLIPNKLNYISDGAMSLRFDQNSQNSFLSQIFAYTKTDQKIATLYLGENNFMTLGDMSLKFSEYGYSSIGWVQIQQDENFGKVPTLSDILIEDQVNDIHKKLAVHKPAVLTLSASYIGMHQNIASKLNTKLSKSANCSFEQHGFLRCNYAKKTDRDRDLQKSLTFAFADSGISLDFKDLVLHQEAKYVIFNIKKLYQDDYLILGEPVMKKYTLYLDYAKERIGFAARRLHFQKPIINVVTLIRFLVMIFSCGCCCILCSSPARVLWNHLNSRKISRKFKPGKQGLRLKQYQPVQQQNGFDQFTQRVREIIASRETTEVDGHPDDSI